MPERADVKDLIDKLRQGGFDTLRSHIKERSSQIYVDSSYKTELTKGMDPTITTRIPLPGRRLAIEIDRAASIMNASYKFHAEPQSDKKREESKADDIELYFAELFYSKFNAGNMLFTNTRRYQARGPAAFWWLDWEQFKLPEQEDNEDDKDYEARKESYRKHYQPFSLKLLDPKTVLFDTDDEGDPVYAAREYEMSLLDVSELYGKAKDKAPLDILREEFPYLRGGRSEEVDSTTRLGTVKAKVWIFADKGRITHCIEVGSGNDSKMHEVFDAPNPWGRVPLFIVHGRFNHDAEELVDRYQGVLENLYGESQNFDVLRTHIASTELTPKKYGVIMHEQLASQVAAGDVPSPKIEFVDGVALLPGEVAEFGNIIGEGTRYLLETQKIERDAAMNPPYLTNPDQVTLRNTTAAAELNAHETANRLYDDARASFIGQIVAVCDAVRHFMTGGYLNKKGSDGKVVGPESLWIVPSGKSKTKDYRGERTAIELDPSCFALDYTLEISIAPTTQSQKVRGYELTKQEVVDGAKPRSALIEEVNEDATRAKKEINEETLYQTLAPSAFNLTFLKFIQTEKSADGMSLERIAVANGLIDPALVGLAPMDESGIGGARTDAPATSPSSVTAVG